MATGDQNDVLARINAVLPPWFNSEPDPILTGALSAFANDGSFFYGQSQYVQLQMRITTATDQNLDEIANDYFGVNGLPRGINEGDTSYRNRILALILAPKATRQAIINVVTELTGNVPKYFQPCNPADGGGYSVGGAGYSVAGGWSSWLVPYQAFLTAYVTAASTIAYLSGYNISFGAWNTPSPFAWCNKGSSINSLTLAQIYQAIATTQCAGTVIWCQVQNI